MSEGTEGGGGGGGSSGGGVDQGAESVSNDQKLAHFQELTHLDDFEQCQAILESTNWNLDQAIQSYFTQFTGNETETPAAIGGTDAAVNTNLDDDYIIRGVALGPQQTTNILEQQQETLNSFFNNLSTQNLGKSSRRLLTFNLTYLNQTFTLYIQDNENVAKLKELVEEKVGIPRKHIKLNGWQRIGGGMHKYISDNCLLNELGLPMVNNLHVVNMQTIADDIQNAISHLPGVAFASASSITVSVPENFEIFIKLVQSGDDKVNRLNFNRQATFIEIRRRLTTLTGLIANDQEWWYYKPRSGVSEEDQLADLKSINSTEKFQEVQNAERLFGVPLDSIAEDGVTLGRIKELLDELLSGEHQQQPNFVESKSTPSTSLATSTASISKNKLMFVINNRGPSEGVKPSTSGLGDQAQTSLSDYVLVNDGSQVEEFEAEDALMTHDEELDENFLLNEESDSASKRKALITTECPAGDELLGTTMFREEFLARYGPIIPLFYSGKLEDAIRDALVCSARDRRLLGIYLHSDQTVFCNIFASKTLCDETVINFLSSNFVVWPWDLSVRVHESHFYNVCGKHFGSIISSKLLQHRDKLPLFLIVTRVRSTNEIVAIVEGDSTSDQMMQRLMQCSEMFETQRMSDERDERERDERERIKREQDQAYRESLANDKAKRQRHEAEEEVKRREREKAEEEEKQRIEAIERRKADALSRLTPEPNPNEPLVAKIRFRLPDGETCQRCFYAKDKLVKIIDFITSHGYFPDDYKLLSSWPRRDLTTESFQKTLEELKLYPQETLTLEQR